MSWDTGKSILRLSRRTTSSMLRQLLLNECAMTKKAKQQASDAFGQLEHYLRRDAEGREYLRAAQIFVGELRKERTQLKARIESQERVVKEAREALEACRIELANEQQQVRQLKAMSNQLVRDLAELREQADTNDTARDIDQEPLVEDLYVAGQDHFQPDKRVLLIKRLHRILQKRIGKLPKAIYGWHKAGAMNIQPDDMLQSFNTYECLNVGLTVALGVVCGYTVCFPGSPRRLSHEQQRQLSAVANWLYPWSKVYRKPGVLPIVDHNYTEEPTASGKTSREQYVDKLHLSHLRKYGPTNSEAQRVLLPVDNPEEETENVPREP